MLLVLELSLPARQQFHMVQPNIVIIIWQDMWLQNMLSANNQTAHISVQYS